MGKSVKVLRFDRRGKYFDQKILKYLKDNSTVSQWIPPGIPQLNRISERRNRTLLDMIRSMMSFTDLPLFLWDHALLTAIHLLNRVPSKSVPTTPYRYGSVRSQVWIILRLVDVRPMLRNRWWKVRG